MIRQARVDDADAIWEIFQLVVAGRDTYLFHPDTPRAEGVGYWFGDDVTSFVAEVDQRVVGVYKLIENRRGLGAHVSNASFMVHPEASGRGVGYSMGLHALHEARGQGYDAMQFNFVVSTNARGVALWQRLGFTIVGTLPRAFQHGKLGLVDAYVMHRFLDDIIPTFGTLPPAEDAATRPSVYAVIVNADRQIAIVLGNHGWMLPGGGIDEGETPEQTVRRETAEECAIRIDVVGSLGDALQMVTSPGTETTVAKQSRFFSATAVSAIDRTRPEHATRWAPPAEACGAMALGSHAWAIRRWLRLNS